MGEVIISTSAAPVTPPSGTVSLYPDSTSKRLSSKDDAAAVIKYVGIDTTDTLSNKTLDTSNVGTTEANTVNSTKLATTAFVIAASPHSSYRSLLQAEGSLTAALVAGTYGLPNGEAAVVSGGSSVYPLGIIYIAAADYPSYGGLAPKLRIRAMLYTNDVAPTGNFTFGLYPITRPGTSGGAGVAIYTIGTVVSGSNGATFTTPAADGLLNAVGADFALPADGHYIIAVVTTATIAASAHVHANAILQLHNV